MQLQFLNAQRQKEHLKQDLADVQHNNVSILEQARQQESLFVLRSAVSKLATAVVRNQHRLIAQGFFRLVYILSIHETHAQLFEHSSVLSMLMNIHAT